MYDKIKIREEKENLIKALQTYYSSNRQGVNKSIVANILTEHLRDEAQINQFKTGAFNIPRTQSLKISNEELAQTAEQVGGKKGYEESQSTLNYDLWVQTQTPTYKKMFGENPPTILLHGTKNEFDRFSDEITQHQGRTNAGNNFGNGHYFTDNQHFAENYAGDKGNIKQVIINTASFIDISETYESREKELDKKDQSYLLLKAMVNEALAENNPEKLQKLEIFANSLALDQRAVTDPNVLQNLDQSVYQVAGFSGIVWNKFDGKNEIIAFSAQDILHKVDNGEVDLAIQKKTDNTIVQDQAKQEQNEQKEIPKGIEKSREDLIKELEDLQKDMLRNRTQEITIHKKEPIEFLGVTIPFIKREVSHTYTEWKTQADKDVYKNIKDDIKSVKNTPNLSQDKNQQYQNKIEQYKTTISALKSEKSKPKISVEERIEHSQRFNNAFKQATEKVAQQRQKLSQSQSMKM